MSAETLRERLPCAGLLLLWACAGLLLVAAANLDAAVPALWPRVALESAWYEGQLQPPPGYAPQPGWPHASDVATFRFRREDYSFDPSFSDRALARVEDRSPDPWGNPWRSLWQTQSEAGGDVVHHAYLPYSVGADGIDEGGEGDDQFVFPTRYRLAPYAAVHGALWLRLAAAWLVWWAIASPVLEPRSTWTGEVFQVACAAGPPLALLAWDLTPAVDLLESALVAAPQLPMEHCVTLSYAVANVLVALSVRTLLARTEEAGADPAAGSEEAAGSSPEDPAGRG